MELKEHIETGSYLYEREKRSDEVQEIITSVPSWIIRWGISLVFAILGAIIVASSLIEYPDVVKVTLKVSSLNAPKSVLSYQGGKLMALLVKDGRMVKENQPLAYLESTGSPEDILDLSKFLRRLQNDLSMQKNVSTEPLPVKLNLGELQSSFQAFNLEFMQYAATKKNGYYLNKRAFLEKDLKDILLLKAHIAKQQAVQRQEFENIEAEFNSYQKLYQKKVISRSEFAQQENKFLSAKYPLQQTETALLNNTSSYNSKEKELLELDNIITEQQSNFVQALNKFITETDAWVLRYILRSPSDGRLSYAGIIQENQNVMTNQEVFIVNPGNTDYFGEVQIPQYNMGKIRLGERTLVKMRSYPFEQYGLIRGTLSHVSDVAYKDSVFLAKIQFDRFENKDPERKIILKNGMNADAEIITENSSLLQRFFRNVTKIIDNRGEN
ncbi:HlyD family efflux transporter periplasmic adaptor subunit [Pedobacter polaris]|uniref:HlyD family efflux transporter periplasmic adaptor subunit n=1 Tax=Pedobacter polaris TaxID=2571273 RepID=A0A4U1CMW8_9SPHI|nr:HlyD family efflux transporter periplasmic adaptor subunit [Pedobacter polaris]TKC08003.1 HlyD family efflux transporter periplasmic adaptor subunit [Pedobacter polaris]